MRLVFFLLLIAAYFTCRAQYKPREYYKYVCVPEIKLVGKWLRNSGFKEGEFVKVEVRNKRIVITLDEEKSR